MVVASAAVDLLLTSMGAATMTTSTSRAAMTPRPPPHTHPFGGTKSVAVCLGRGGSANDEHRSGDDVYHRGLGRNNNDGASLGRGEFGGGKVGDVKGKVSDSHFSGNRCGVDSGRQRFLMN
ncbi:Os09g0435650 [Oryza sativa Japonica Group]|uniref:Os09g0435650 protein n=2 Tax=Oryza sativa subsp. japonica TaxID=39947 RepID=Q69PF2_ORYSJ|nr:hypothetical protein [Oryza sativa Japonica Group]BAT08243.1 Os09g0435650 [Oryza sativa Japonica Group]